jgi:transketolase
LGHALAARLDDLTYRVYVMIGDGESDEGQVWEAAMSAAKFGVENLTVILDANQYQQTGSINEVMPTLEPIGDKWRSFGWRVTEINGHNMKEVMDAFRLVKNTPQQPQMIIARTLKGRGLSPFEADETNRKHGKPLDEEEMATALAELDERVEWDIHGEMPIEMSTPEGTHGED